MAKNRIAAIDIGSHAVKVAVLTPAGKGHRVESVASSPLAQGGGADALAAAVKSAMTEAGARGDKCVVALPRSKSVVRRLTDLPSGLDSASLRDIIRLQAESELPFEPGTAAYDYYSLIEGESGASVELVAARTDDIEQLLAPVREAGGKPIGVTPAVAGIGAMAAALGFGTGSGPGVLVLDVGHSSTDAALVRDGAVVFTRSFPVGAAALADDPDGATARLVTEVDRTVQAIERDTYLVGAPTGAPFDSMWLCGGGVAAAVRGDDDGAVSLAALLQAKLGLPVTAQAPSGAIEDGAGLASIPGAWSLYAVAIGLCIEARGGNLAVDLMPRAERQRHEQSARTRVLLAYVAAAALLIAAFTFLGGQLSAREARRLGELDQRISALGSSRKRAADKLSDMNAMTEMLERKHSVLDVLRELTELLPNRQDIAVTVLNIEASGKVTVSFEANSADAMSSAVRSMGTSVWFRDVTPGQVTTAEKNGKQVQQFAVTLYLEDDVDLLAARRSGAAAAAAEAAALAAAEGDESGGEEVASNSRGGGPGGRRGQGGRGGDGGPGRRGGRPGRSGSGGSDGGGGRSGRGGSSGNGRQVFSVAGGGSRAIEGGRVTVYSASGDVLREYDAGPEVAEGEEEEEKEEEERTGGSYVEKRDDAGDGADGDKKREDDEGGSDGDEKRDDGYGDDKGDDGDSTERRGDGDGVRRVRAADADGDR
ncbi:MAG: pilus assembly protein PilM [Candidatus Poribacteria bacterium]